MRLATHATSWDSDTWFTIFFMFATSSCTSSTMHVHCTCTQGRNCTPFVYVACRMSQTLNFLQLLRQVPCDSTRQAFSLSHRDDTYSTTECTRYCLRKVFPNSVSNLCLTVQLSAELCRSIICFSPVERTTQVPVMPEVVSAARKAMSNPLHFIPEVVSAARKAMSNPLHFTPWQFVPTVYISYCLLLPHSSSSDEAF